MPVAEHLSLRVNGIEYGRVGLQYALRDDHPSGPLEVVIKDDPIGRFPLTDECRIELRDDGGTWKPVSLTYLLTLMQTFTE